MLKIGSLIGEGEIDALARACFRAFSRYMHEAPSDPEVVRIVNAAKDKYEYLSLPSLRDPPPPEQHGSIKSELRSAVGSLITPAILWIDAPNREAEEYFFNRMRAGSTALLDRLNDQHPGQRLQILVWFLESVGCFDPHGLWNPDRVYTWKLSELSDGEKREVFFRLEAGLFEYRGLHELAKPVVNSMDGERLRDAFLLPSKDRLKFWYCTGLVLDRCAAVFEETETKAILLKALRRGLRFQDVPPGWLSKVSEEETRQIVFLSAEKDLGWHPEDLFLRYFADSSLTERYQIASQIAKTNPYYVRQLTASFSAEQCFEILKIAAQKLPDIIFCEPEPRKWFSGLEPSHSPTLLETVARRFRRLPRQLSTDQQFELILAGITGNGWCVRLLTTEFRNRLKPEQKAQLDRLEAFRLTRILRAHPGAARPSCPEVARLLAPDVQTPPVLVPPLTGIQKVGQAISACFAQIVAFFRRLLSWIF